MGSAMTHELAASICWLVLQAAAVPPAFAAGDVSAAGPAKVFEGPTGETVTLVFLAPKTDNRVLIAFDGVDGVWDGRVLLHRREVNRDKEDYVLDGEKLRYV